MATFLFVVCDGKQFVKRYTKAIFKKCWKQKDKNVIRNFNILE
jgi:hypothetical protein